MSLYSLLSFVAALFSISLAFLVILRDRKSFAHQTFSAGMILLALEAVFAGISLQAVLPIETVYWQRIRLVTKAFIPGVWLLFALTYARVNYKEIVTRWRWVVSVALIIPLTLTTFFWKYFFIGEPVLDSPSVWLIRLGWSGYSFHLCFLLSAVLILVNLERTLRASVGHMRWQVKYMVLGLGSVFAAQIYTDSQTVLFHSLNIGLSVVNVGILIVANALILRSLLRTRLLDLDIYLSHSFLYNSLTVLIVGIYFLVVGVLAQLIRNLNGGLSLYLNAFLIFLVLLGLSIILLSDKLRQKIKRFISLYLKRSQYDYRKEWMELTQATTSITEIRDLCSAVVKKLSRTFETLSVTIWLLDEKEERLLFGGSTVLVEGQTKSMKFTQNGAEGFISTMRNKNMPFDLDQLKDQWVLELKEAYPDYFKETRGCYCAPLTAGDHFLGLLTLGDRVAKEPFSLADSDLIRTIADQTAAMLLNLKLSERLRQVKEREAFQSMSAFIMHDLKNLASSLSLTMQNLPAHFDNPEFRNDALQIIRQSVTKINGMCSHLSMLSQKIELKKIETNLNEMIKASLSYLNGSSKVQLILNLQPLPIVMIDPDQVQKVLTNLILNANDAVGNSGQIDIATSQKDSWAILSVSDNGCGMSKEFIAYSLFRPFKTTKKEGIGIGLFQSKMIVEAHQGRIEVESEEGKGSTFRVLLPLARE